MFRNFLTIAKRNLLKQKVYSLINIIGLAVGITSTILIIFYLQFEFSFDKFHKDAANKYRLSFASSREGKIEYESPIFVPPVGPDLKSEYPEVEQYTRFSTPRTYHYYVDNKYFKISGNIYADSTFFDLFSFNVIAGNKKSVLSEPYSIVLTKRIAQRIFGNKNPIGEALKLGNNFVYKIAGVVDDPPANSEIQFNALLSFSSLYKNPKNYMDWNGGNQYYTYIKLKNGISQKSFESKFPDFMWRHINQELSKVNIVYKASLQPLTDIHLKYNESNEAGMTNIYIFSVIALLIILIASVNFINLSIARSSKRIKEIGIRKILGAGRKNLFFQFITEYLIISFAVLLVVILLLELFYPSFNVIAGQNISLINPYSLVNILQVLGIIFLVGILAGGYPASYLSSLEAIKSIKGEKIERSNKVNLKNILLVSQFVISILLIISTIFIAKQLSFINNKDLGFDKDNIVVLPLLNDESKNNIPTLRNSLSSLNGVENVSGSSDIPHNNFTSNGYFPEGFSTPVMIHVLDCDQDFLKTYRIQIKDGRNFVAGRASDSSTYLINEALAEKLNWKDPVGKTIRRGGIHTVIGVVKNFNYSSLHEGIEPLIITEKPYRNLFDFVSIKIGSGNIAGTLAAIKTNWEKINPNTAFDYSFLESDIEQLYNAENNFKNIFFTFTSIAIILALFGLFSLASLSTEQRKKEIVIRKVLGDTSTGIIFKLMKEYIAYIFVANIIAWPLAYYFVQKWLNNFVYRIEINWLMFLLAGVATMIIALFTVIWQATRAASANPAESLRYE